MNLKAFFSGVWANVFGRCASNHPCVPPGCLFCHFNLLPVWSAALLSVPCSVFHCSPCSATCHTQKVSHATCGTACHRLTSWYNRYQLSCVVINGIQVLAQQGEWDKETSPLSSAVSGCLQAWENKYCVGFSPFILYTIRAKVKKKSWKLAVELHKQQISYFGYTHLR